MIETKAPQRVRPVFYAALAAALLLSVGIWWLNRPPKYDFAEVTGVVTLDGQPLAEVEVRFLPDPGSGTLGPMSSCFTDKDGRYAIRCDQYEHDGAVPGTHRVVVFDIAALPEIPLGFAPATKTERPQKPSRVPGKYEHLSTTPFTDIAVKPGKQELNFALVSKPK